jgi:pimeloyl-ACP methyl ester carboxylesterase
LLLAFHGYGDEASIFSPLRDYLLQEYTFLSIDLPHHGESKWEHGMLYKDELFELVRRLMTEYNAEKVSLLGYSMGGRVCLTILEHMPQAVDKVVLLATDGLAVNFFYFFFTRTSIGKRVFNNMLEKPGPYLKTIEWLRKRNLVNASRYKFVMHFLQEEEGRKFLQKVWPDMSDLMPSPSKLRLVIKKHHIPVNVIMGAHDKIIPPALAKKFGKGLDTVKVCILEKGHRVFDNENAQQIAGHLL